MDKMSKKGTFIGYSNESKRYWLYNLETNNLIIITVVIQAIGIGMRILLMRVKNTRS